MKKYSTFIILFIIGNLAIAQTPLYYRIKVNTDEKGLNQLSKMGVTIEHGEMIKGQSYTSDFSEYELDLIKKSGLNHEIQISDVSNYYVNRNKLKLDALKLLYRSWETWLCPLPPTPKNFRFGTMGGFYKYNELLAALDSMVKKFPNLISQKTFVSSTLKTYQGRPLYYVRISNSPNKNQLKPKILYTALHHAREPISASQMIFYMWYLLENYSTSTSVKTLVDGVEMFFIPCVNPDGYVHNQTTNPDGGGMWRKNRRKNADGSNGVDLNRNYKYQFGSDDIGSSGTGSSDIYRGTSAFSEAETQMIQQFCQRFHFNMVINNHSFSNYLVYPWGYSSSATNPDVSTFNTRAAEMTKCNHFLFGTWPAVMYSANGISDDWMYGDNTRPKAFAFTAETGSVEDGFWPPRERIIPLSAANIYMNLKAAQYARSSTVQ